jgi:hypothetical protein
MYCCPFPAPATIRKARVLFSEPSSTKLPPLVLLVFYVASGRTAQKSYYPTSFSEMLCFVNLVRTDISEERRFLQEPRGVISKMTAFFTVNTAKISNLTKCPPVFHLHLLANHRFGMSQFLSSVSHHVADNEQVVISVHR